MSNSTSNAQITDLIAELEWRGLIKDCTDKDALRDHLASGTRKIYAGFDPTADSLTIGNLVPIMMLAHVKRSGHIPVVVMGGGTGLIGDPSGKSAERMMMTEDTVQRHVDCQRPIFENVLGQIKGPEHHIRNNLDWLGKISYIEALRDIGKHFSVNMMMQKESVKERLNNREQGISYTEFSYMILQAYDFAYLYEHDGVTVQFGGSDQYGNIVAGSDLIRRIRSQRFIEVLSWYENALTNELGEGWQEVEFWRKAVGDLRNSINSMQQELEPDSEFSHILFNVIDDSMQKIDTAAVIDSSKTDKALRKFLTELNLDAFKEMTFGLTAPLVQKADGGKFGKTETGAVWLTAARTSPYTYYQFWLNASDEDARNWIRVFTFLPQDEIEALIARHEENPGKRELQRTLAQHATSILHGKAEMENAEAAGKALFSGDIAALDKKTLVEVFASVPTTVHKKSELEGEGVDPIELLKSCDLASSNREAREFLGSGSVSINGEKIDADTRINTSHLLHGSYIAIRRGKKKWVMTQWE